MTSTTTTADFKIFLLTADAVTDEQSPVYHAPSYAVIDLRVDNPGKLFVIALEAREALKNGKMVCFETFTPIGNYSYPIPDLESLPQGFTEIFDAYLASKVALES